jgi:hypothetical protein
VQVKNNCDILKSHAIAFIYLIILLVILSFCGAIMIFLCVSRRRLLVIVVCNCTQRFAHAEVASDCRHDAASEARTATEASNAGNLASARGRACHARSCMRVLAAVKLPLP